MKKDYQSFAELQRAKDEAKERKHDKKIKKILKRIGIAFGIGLGFLIIVPLLPEITDKEKMEEVKSLFSLFGVVIMGYSLAMILIIFFLRRKALLFDRIFNFFVVPSFVVWFGMEIYKILG